jgi:hypothetical protein
VNATSSQAPETERKISRRAQLLGAAGLVAGAAALRPGLAQAASTAGGPLTIQATSGSDFPLTLVGASGQSSDYLAINQSDGSSVARINAAGALYLGSPTQQSLIRFRGTPSYGGATPGEEVVWEMGVDSANNVQYRDFFLGQRIAADSVADLLYISAQNAGQQPIVSIAAPGNPGVHKASLAIGIWGTTVSQAYHNLALLVRDTANPPQTGKALTVISSADKELFSVAVDGTTQWRAQAGNLLASVANNGDIYTNHQISTAMTGWITAGGNGANVDYGGVEAMGGIWATSARPQIVTGVLKAMSSQTADVLQCQGPNSKPHFSVTSAGLPKWSSPGDQQQSVGSGGSAAPLPNTPTTYLKVVDSSGNTYVIPAFDAGSGAAAVRGT